MNTGQSRRAVWAGTITAFLLVAGFGNQWLFEKILKKDDVGDNSGWHILGWLNTPRWIIDPSGYFDGLDGKYVAAGIVGAIALLITVAVVLAAAARRADFNVFIAGWFSLVLGGAVYSLTAYLISGSRLGYPLPGEGGDRNLGDTLDALARGGGYGLLAGWAVGLVCALAAGSRGYAPYASYAPPPPPNPPQAGGYRY
jgi:hypothetical protein